MPLDFAPGKGIHYSNTNYAILGYILEKVTKTPYQAYLRKNILQPLGMQDSGLDNRLIVLPQRAYGYQSSSLLADYVDPSQLYSALGLYSTVEDLLRFDQALYTDKLLPQAALAPMITAPAEPIFEPSSYFGYGWFIEPMAGHQAIDTGGWVPGFNTEIDRFRAEKLTVIILANEDSGDVHSLIESLEKMIFANQ